MRIRSYCSSFAFDKNHGFPPGAFSSLGSLASIVPLSTFGPFHANLVRLRLDGERCAETIHSIFENAKDPDRIIIGLAEQNAPEDNFCLEEYCKKYGTCRSRRPEE